MDANTLAPVELLSSVERLSLAVGAPRVRQHVIRTLSGPTSTTLSTFVLLPSVL